MNRCRLTSNDSKKCLKSKWRKIQNIWIINKANQSQLKFLNLLQHNFATWRLSISNILLLTILHSLTFSSLCQTWVFTFLGGGAGFLDLIPWCLRRCCTPPDSSDSESRLSVDWPVKSLMFSGEDSSAKLCIVGGDVSELPPDLGPTAIKKIKGLKEEQILVLLLYYRDNYMQISQRIHGIQRRWTCLALLRPKVLPTLNIY